jgi:uncharacterized protein YbjT (DUF2867 family)
MFAETFNLYIMYIITGASGNTGKRIAQILLSANQEVTVVSRNLNHIQDLIELGAKPAIGDLQDVEFMTQILRGAKAAYLLIPPNFQTPDFRKYQFELGEALAKAVADSQIPNVVLLSSVGAHLTENSGVILGLHNFEQLVKNIPNLNSLAIRAGFFMQNFFGNIKLIKNMHIHGGFPVNGDIAFGMIHANDIADFAAQKLLDLDFIGASHHNLIGQRELSFEQATQVLGRAIGNPDLPWVTFSYEDAYKGMVGAGLTDSMANLYIEFSKSINEGFLTNDFKPTNESLTKTSIEQFSLEFAAAYSQD